MRTHHPPSQPADTSPLTLQDYLPGAPGMMTIFVKSLAERLEEFIRHYDRHDARMVPGIAAAVATLRSQRPLDRAWVLLKGNDNRTGRFTLGLGCTVGFPVHLYVEPCLNDLAFPPKNENGRVIFGLKRGRMNAIYDDLDIAMEVITSVLSNRGLYGASHWEATEEPTHPDEVEHGS